jgi:hypothetical protein
MRSIIRFIPALVLVVATGCGGGASNKQLNALVQRLQVVESRVERLAGSIESCRSSVQKIDSTLSDANFHSKQLPNLAREVDALKLKLAEASRILKGVSRKDEYLVLPGVMVADDKGNPRCLVSTTGLAIWDGTGRRVGQMEYDEAARAMTASLRGYGTKSVALYAGKDRVAIGAYDSRADGPVGWAATVSPEGEVTAGRAGR